MPFWKFRPGICHPILMHSLHPIPPSGFNIRLRDRNCLVLEDWLKEKAQRPDHTHNYKDPEKQPIHHHGDVLPVFNDLERNQEQNHITSKTRNLLEYKARWQMSAWKRVWVKVNNFWKVIFPATLGDISQLCMHFTLKLIYLWTQQIGWRSGSALM